MRTRFYVDSPVEPTIYFHNVVVNSGVRISGPINYFVLQRLNHIAICMWLKFLCLDFCLCIARKLPLT